MSLPQELADLQSTVWSGSIPLQIRLAAPDCRSYDKSDPYLVQYPRLSYLPLLLPRLLAFFRPALIDPSVDISQAWFSFEDVPLKWHYPAGLLYDLFSGSSPTLIPSPRHPPSTQTSSLPWRLTLHLSAFPDSQIVHLDEDKVLHDAWLNSVKEADFLRNGTAKAIMSLSKEDSTQLWTSLKTHDFRAWAAVHNKLIPPSATLRNIPVRVYLPTSVPEKSKVQPPTLGQRQDNTGPGEPPGSPEPKEDSTPSAGHIKVIQSLVPAVVPMTRTPLTVGDALNSALKSLFPSRRTPVLARPVLHGAVLPMSAPLEEIMRAACFADGWVHLGVDLMG